MEDMYRQLKQAGQRALSDSFGFVLSAGGARGAYQFGFMRALVENGIKVSSMSGSSIGALNSLILAIGDFEKGKELWLQMTRDWPLQIDYDKLTKLGINLAGDLAVLLLPLPNKASKVMRLGLFLAKFASSGGTLGQLREFGIFKLDALRSVLEQFIDMERVIKQSKPVFLTVCGEADIESPLGVARSHDLRFKSVDEAWDILWASMAVPVVFSPVQLYGEVCTDGGVGEWLPIRPLYHMGERRIIAICTKANVSISPSEYLGARIEVFGPSKSLGRFPAATFRFTETAVVSWMDEGHADGLEALKKLKENGSPSGDTASSYFLPVLK